MKAGCNLYNNTVIRVSSEQVVSTKRTNFGKREMLDKKP